MMSREEMKKVIEAGGSIMLPGHSIPITRVSDLPADREEIARLEAELASQKKKLETAEAGVTEAKARAAADAKAEAEAAKKAEAADAKAADEAKKAADEAKKAEARVIPPAHDVRSAEEESPRRK